MKEGTRVEISQDVASEQLDGETVVLDPNSGVYFTLNASGTVIWNALIQHGNTGAAKEALVEHFGIPPARAQADVQALIAQLGDAGLLRCGNVGGATTV